MKKFCLPALLGCLALLVGCMESNSPEHGAVPDEKIPLPQNGLVLRDPDNNPVREVPVELLMDIRRQMVEKGLTDDIKHLEAAYDFNTGKLKLP